MLTAFPTPILSIAADAVRDLEGRDALSGLWILFTKCKESLQDGRRLENISWRLWYREMMREDLMNRRYQEKLSEEEDQDHALSTPGAHTPTDLYRPPTPSESESTSAPPPYAVRDANGLTDSTYRPLISAPTVLPHDHDHTTSSPTFSSSRLGPTEVTMFRSISPGDSASIPPLDSASASLQVSKSKFNSDTVLSPVVPAQPFSLSSSSTQPKSRDFAGAPPHIRQSTHRRKVQDPVCVGRIIYDMLPRSSSNASEESRSRVTVWSPSMTTTTTGKLPASAPVVDPSSSLQVAALTPVALAELPSSPELISNTDIIVATIASTPSPTTNARYTSLHAFPPSPSLSDSYVIAHPSEVEVSDTTRLDVGMILGPSLSVSASSPSSPQILGNAHIFGLPPDPQLPPRLVVVKPTPNPTPHPTPPASPLIASAPPSPSGAGTGSNDCNGTKSNWLSLPPNHHPQNDDRSRSVTTAVTTPDIINLVLPVEAGPSMGSLSTVHSISVGKGGDDENDSVTSDEELGDGGSIRLKNATTTMAAASTKKKKIGVKKIKTKTKSFKRNSLKSLTSPPPPPPLPLQQSQKQETGVPAPPMARRASNGRSSSRSMSQSGSSVGVGAETNSSRSRSREAAHHPPVHRHPVPPQRQHQRVKSEDQVAERQLQEEEKGKGRAHSKTNSKLPRTTSQANISNVYLPPPPPPGLNTNTKQETHETLNLVSSALAAKVKRTLADPLLPGQHKRTIVLTTSDSEYEDSEDDGSWSSEEMGSEDEQDGQRAEQQEQQQELLAQQYQQQQEQLQRQVQEQQQLQQQQQQQPQLQQLHHRPPPLQRAHTTNHPPTANHNLTLGANRIQRAQSSRDHRHPSNHSQGQALMTKAAEEAQRQRDMFAKKPTESFQNLAKLARTRSVGLLSQLMNPNPAIFPVGHPYRRGYSSSEIRGGGDGERDHDRGFRPPPPPKDVKATKARALSPPACTLSMQRSKSTAATPVSSEVQVGSVSTHTSNDVGGGHEVVNGFGMATVNSGGYRPKGPPQDQELEDESGSEAESFSGIQVSKSVAQAKLKALAERRGIVAHGTNQKTQLGDEDVPDWAKVSKAPQARRPTQTRSQSQGLDHNANRRTLHFGQMITSSGKHPTPIPVGHPYNLPPPAPPSTPRTTRRLMLSTELSESLRRNLLWERQVSKVNLAAAVRRTASTGGSRHSVPGDVQPLTDGPNMVKLLPKGTMVRPNPGSPVRPGQGGGGIKERRASGGAVDGSGPSAYDENEKERERRLAMARNLSWANDYHFAGW